MCIRDRVNIRQHIGVADEEGLAIVEEPSCFFQPPARIQQALPFIGDGDSDAELIVFLQKINDLLPQWNTAFVRPPVKTMNHLGLIFAGLHPHINGIVVGFSSEAQLRETLDFWRNLETFDYSDVFSALKKILLPAQITR